MSAARPHRAQAGTVQPHSSQWAHSAWWV